MNPDQTFRDVLIAVSLLIFPIALYHRIRSQMSGEKLDRWQEGPFILFTLRPVGIAHMFGLFAYMIDPTSMAWASVPLPVWLRWVGVAIGVMAAGSLLWTLRSLGKNLTDTVVTRREHTLVRSGPYRWVRHPFYGSVALAMLANSLAAANAFLFVDRRVARRPARCPDAYRRGEAGRAVRRLLSQIHGGDRSLSSKDREQADPLSVKQPSLTSFRTPARVAGVVQKEPPHRHRVAAALLPDRRRRSRCDIHAGAGRGAVFRVDRRRAATGRCGQFQPAIQPAAFSQYLEPGEHPPRRTPD